MKDVHVTPELLTALYRFELPPELLLRLAWDHLQALCPKCEEGVQGWLAERGAGHRYDDAFENAQKALEEKEQDAQETKERIEREIAEILRLDPEEAVERIKAARKRFRSMRLVERLLAEARRELNGDPRKAVVLLTYARAIVERRGEPISPDWRLRVLIHYANALRAARRHREAERSFRAAREIIQNQPFTSYDLYALLYRLEASLHKDRKNFHEAERLLSLAVLIYRVFGDEEGAVRSLIKLAAVYHHLEENGQALSATHEARGMLDPDEHLKLSAIATQNLAYYMNAEGDSVGARRVLNDSRDLLQRYIQVEQAEAFRLLVVWLEGCIARDLGEYREAEGKLLETAEGFSALEIGYDTALVLLDLADSHLAEGERSAVPSLIPQIEPLLSANDLDREIIAALLLLQNSIAQELVSTSTVAMVRKKMQAVGRIPPGRGGGN